MNAKMSRRSCKQSPYNPPHSHHRTMFLPIMICSRSSLKDVHLSHSRIACSGHPKRDSKLTGLPLSFSSAAKADRNPKSTGVSGVASVRPGKEREYACDARSKCGREDRRRIRAAPDAKPINVAELDPPLPVVRRRQLVGGENGGDDRESLWKRRSRAAPLRSLQVQSVHGGGASSVQAEVANTV